MKLATATVLLGAFATLTLSSLPSVRELEVLQKCASSCEHTIDKMCEVPRPEIISAGDITKPTIQAVQCLFERRDFENALLELSGKRSVVGNNAKVTGSKAGSVNRSKCEKLGVALEAKIAGARESASHISAFLQQLDFALPCHGLNTSLCHGSDTEAAEDLDETPKAPNAIVTLALIRILGLASLATGMLTSDPVVAIISAASCAFSMGWPSSGKRFFTGCLLMANMLLHRIH